jgi:GNAT superfamily N-acetyltransferase
LVPPFLEIVNKSFLSLQEDAWLASFLNKAAFRVVDQEKPLPSFTSRLPKQLESSAFAWARVPVTAPEFIRDLEELGFVCMEINVVFEKKDFSDGDFFKTAPCDFQHFREARDEDRKVLGDIAASAFEHSRFYRDEKIEKVQARALKRMWLENFFEGRRGDRLFVVEAEGRPVAFNLLIEDEPGLWRIDLIAVAPPFRGRAYGAGLIAFAENVLKPDLLRVGTQLRNRPSLALYSSRGFRFSGAFQVLHFHT